MAFANPPNYSSFLTPPTAPFRPEATDLGTILRTIQDSQQFSADEKQRGMANQQAAANAAEAKRSNLATEKYNFGQQDIQRQLWARADKLRKEQDAAAQKKQVDELIAELDFAQRSKNTVRVNEVKERLRRHGLTVEEIERAAAPSAPTAPPAGLSPEQSKEIEGATLEPHTPEDDALANMSPEQIRMLEGAKLEPPSPEDEALAKDPNFLPGLSPRESGAISPTAPIDPYAGVEKASLRREAGLQVRDRSGNVIHTTPEDQFGDSARLVEQGLKPIFDGAPDYGKAAAEAARGYGTALVEAGVPPAEAMEKAIGHYEKRMAEIEKTMRTDLASSRYKGGGGAAGPGMQSIRLATQQVNQHTNAVARDYKINGINEALNDLNKAEQAITSAEGGVGEIAAVTNVLKSLQGRISNYDMEQFIGSGGLMSQLTSLAGRTFGRGELDPTYLQQVRVLIQQTRQVLQAKKQEAARVLQQRIDTDYAIDRVPELKQQYKGWGEIVTGGQGGGSGGGEPTTDELLEAAE